MKVLMTCIVALLAGCTSVPGLAPAVPDEPAKAISLTYGCPGGPAQDSPCMAPWKPLPPTGGQAIRIAVDPSNADRLAILEWSPVPTGPDAPQPQVIGITTPGRAAVTVSTDGGVTWQGHLVPGDQPVSLPPGTLLGLDVAWTSSGALVVVGYIEDTVNNQLDGTPPTGYLGGWGPTWIGWSSDEGKTWTTALLHRSNRGIWASVAQLQAGVLASAWADVNGSLWVSWSHDDARTWSEPVMGGRCEFPSAPVADGTGFLIGCQDPYAYSTIKNHYVIAVDPAKSVIQDRGVADTPGESGCTTMGPVRRADGMLLVVSACAGIQLFASSDNGTTWVPFGVVALTDAPQAEGSDVFGLVAGPDGMVSALFGAVHRPNALPGCCRTNIHWVTWGEGGMLLGDQHVATWDPDSPLTFTQWPFARSSMGVGADHVWAMPSSPTALGWMTGTIS